MARRGVACACARVVSAMCGNRLDVGPPLRGGALVVDTGILLLVRVTKFNELVGDLVCVQDRVS